MIIGGGKEAFLYLMDMNHLGGDSLGHAWPESCLIRDRHGIETTKVVHIHQI